MVDAGSTYAYNKTNQTTISQACVSTLRFTPNYLHHQNIKKRPKIISTKHLSHRNLSLAVPSPRLFGAQAHLIFATKQKKITKFFYNFSKIKNSFKSFLHKKTLTVPKKQGLVSCSRTGRIGLTFGANEKDTLFIKSSAKTRLV